MHVPPTRLVCPPVLGGALSGFSFLVIADGAGFLAARADTANKLIWRGAEIAAPLLKDCPSRSVHVYTSWGFVSGLCICCARSRGGVPLASDAPATTWIDGRDSICPVLGWAEHVLYRDNKRLKDDFVFTASNDELLQFLKIRAPPTEVDIYRHEYGFVVLWRDTLELSSGKPTTQIADNKTAQRSATSPWQLWLRSLAIGVCLPCCAMTARHRTNRVELSQ